MNSLVFPYLPHFVPCRVELAVLRERMGWWRMIAIAFGVFSLLVTLVAMSTVSFGVVRSRGVLKGFSKAEIGGRDNVWSSVDVEWPELPEVGWQPGVTWETVLSRSTPRSVIRTRMLSLTGGSFELALAAANGLSSANWMTLLESVGHGEVEVEVNVSRWHEAMAVAEDRSDVERQIQGLQLVRALAAFPKWAVWLLAEEPNVLGRLADTVGSHADLTREPNRDTVFAILALLHGAFVRDFGHETVRARAAVRKWLMEERGALFLDQRVSSNGYVAEMAGFLRFAGFDPKNGTTLLDDVPFAKGMAFAFTRQVSEHVDPPLGFPGDFHGLVAEALIVIAACPTTRAGITGLAVKVRRIFEKVSNYRLCYLFHLFRVTALPNRFEGDLFIAGQLPNALRSLDRAYTTPICPDNTRYLAIHAVAPAIPCDDLDVLLSEVMANIPFSAIVAQVPERLSDSSCIQLITLETMRQLLSSLLNAPQTIAPVAHRVAVRIVLEGKYPNVQSAAIYHKNAWNKVQPSPLLPQEAIDEVLSLVK